MKAKSVFFVTVVILLLSARCTTRESFDLKMTIEPQSEIQAHSFVNFGETGRTIIKRLINYGIDSENIKLATYTDRLILTINKTDTSKTKFIEKLVTVPGKIGFYETFENKELIQVLIDANNLLKELKVNIKDVDEEQVTPEKAKDTLQNGNPDIDNLLNIANEDDNPAPADTQNTDSTEIISKREFKMNNPLFSILFLNVNAEGQPNPSCMIGLAAIKDTSKVNRYLAIDKVKALFPHELKFFWSHDPYRWDVNKNLYELHAIKVKTDSGDALLGGSCIVKASPVTNKSGTDSRLSFSMNSEGAKIWAALTRDNIDRCIAVVIDGYVRTYPRVMNEINSGNTEISGNFSPGEAKYLAAIFSSGGKRLPLRLKVSDIQVSKEE